MSICVAQTLEFGVVTVCYHGSQLMLKRLLDKLYSRSFVIGHAGSNVSID